MLSINSAIESPGCRVRVLLQRAPRGTPSSTLTLRLRRCYHHPRLCRPPTACSSPLHVPQSVCSSASLYPSFNRPQGFRLATTSVLPPLSSLSHEAVVHVQSLLVARSNTNVLHNADHPNRSNVFDVDAGDGQIPMPTPTSAPYESSTQSADPFREVLISIREGDTRKALSQLHVIEEMSREEIRDAVAALPRTTFTEFFMALDPLRVARDCDSLGNYHISVGMYQLLNMTSILDDYGVRKLYTNLLQRFLILMSALKAAGHTLHLKEYIAIIRCAGAASDLSGAGHLWRDLSATPLLKWRHSELYNEFMKARFLTKPLYTSYRKTMRMVTPRNLHRSRLLLSSRTIQYLDVLQNRLRMRRLRFDLDKDSDVVSELMRKIRLPGPATRLFWTIIGYHSFRIDESLLCTIMIALGRAGSLRQIGTLILETYFNIRNPHPFPATHESQIRNYYLSSDPPRIRPTVRLMRAVVETYGSNCEISVAIQLVEHLANAYNIPIPHDVWHDLLEWTHIMSTPPASTSWRMTPLRHKVPGPQAVEMIWNVMTSPPYNHAPTFADYDILIRSLIGRRVALELVLAHMRDAIPLYDEQCREYEAAVLEHTLYLRIGTLPSTTIDRFERARYKKQMMWFKISTWCRMLLKRLPTSSRSPIPNPLAPRFIEEFEHFLYNNIKYRTPTGHVTLFDPSLETFRLIVTGQIKQTMPMKNRQGKWIRKKILTDQLEIVSSHSLANFEAPKLRNPLEVIAPHKSSFVPPILPPDSPSLQ
ncbi:mitochondrial ATPase expression-domain-containing protein [Xylaria bambusicola]|uniref:mitochondrial ATPase expression-domain-containing protein n=1 Tax=Xylaria bambusicola TaxID=326684 RepID=UPI002008345A|nr:mitochondrial ATPase expression-domain-containing protein [Xylaria bambusicola]KAI0512712.1 mitochondrial ATPase expression-domain-containing protein [Xylaria bambusicola]